MSDQVDDGSQRKGNGDAGGGPSAVSKPTRGPALAPIAMCLASVSIIGMASLWAAFGARSDGEGRSPRENAPTAAIAAGDTSVPANADGARDMPLPSDPPGPAPEPMTATELSTYASRAVVRITGPRGTGSGFFVREDGLLATNLHVIAQGVPLQVVTADGVAVPIVEIVAKDPTCDLALLRIRPNAGGAWPFLTVATDQAPVIGTHVYALGFPLGMDLTLSEGLISALKRDGAALKHIQITAPISLGSSGGPILLSDGRVIGVAVGFYSSGQSLNLAVPAGELARLMADHAQPSAQAEPPAGERRQRTDVQR